MPNDPAPTTPHPPHAEALSLQTAQALLQASGAALAVVAADGRVHWCNGGWVDWWHGQPPTLLPAAWLPPRSGPVDGVFADGQRWTAQCVAHLCAHEPGNGGAEASARWALSLSHLTLAADAATQTELFADELLAAPGQEAHALQLAVSLSRIGIWRHDLRSDMVHCNAQACEVFGVSPRPGGWPLATLRALIHPDDVAAILASLGRALDAQTPTDMHARYVRNGGAGWRHVMTRRVVERDADGEAIAFVGVALDVSEQAEEAQRALDLSNRLELATAGAWIGVWSREVEDGSGEWNDRMYVIYGRDPARGAPSHDEWLKLVHPDDLERLTRNRDDLLERHDGILEQEFRVMGDDGVVRWVSNWARVERQQGRRTIFGIAMDVTERVLSAAALRGAHERANLVARGAGMGTWEWDPRQNTAVWDDTMFRLRGLAPRPEAPTEAERLAVTHPDDRDRVAAQLRAAVAQRQSANYEFRVVWPDGAVHWLASHSTPVYDEQGRVLRHIGINWDITESHDAAQARREREIAQRESQAKSVFLARMSHELRTPLNAVLGFAQLLQFDDEPLSESQRVKVSHIRLAGEHLLSLINDVLNLSSLDSEHQRPRCQPHAVADLVAQALPLVQAHAHQRDVHLHVAALPGRIEVDAMRMRQVLLNLLSNAIKYNRRGGEVWVSAQPQDQGVCIVVRDTGPGLSAEQQAHLFEPFNRLGAETSGVEGTGMGLVIAKAMVEHMSGRITVRSTVGNGASFELWFPAALPAVPGLPATAAPMRGRLLYIEDNEVNVLVLEALVRSRSNLQICSLPTAAQGIAHALSEPPDLVLVDMQLPDGDGFDVLAALRAAPQTAHLPCIALSANAMPEVMAAARAAGFADYWTKPLDFALFDDAVQRWLAPAPSRGDV